MKRLIALVLMFLFLISINLVLKNSNSSLLLGNNKVKAANKNLIGTKAQEWKVGDWLNSQPIELKNLKGKVVLVRWWTADCPFCSATAPALNEFYQEFHSRGLEVIGLYHHKSSEPLNKQEVYKYSQKLGFKFPIAIDYNWQTLKVWWLNNTDADWTSVSFLIDQRGIIRHIHPGGQYVKGEHDYQVMKQKIEELLNN